jgi:hypothetical protein
MSKPAAGESEMLVRSVKVQYADYVSQGRVTLSGLSCIAGGAVGMKPLETLLDLIGFSSFSLDPQSVFFFLDQNIHHRQGSSLGSWKKRPGSFH